MKKNKDPIETYVIGLMEKDDYLEWHYYDCLKQQTVLYYFKKSQEWVFANRLNSNIPYGLARPWVEMKDQILDFLKAAKPDFERELLREKSELDLTKKTISAL